VAACDLNSDHPAEPDWNLVGEMPCKSCGEPVVRVDGGFAHVDGGFAHVDGGRDADHAADPVLPVG
jgi:hypothetical protein